MQLNPAAFNAHLGNIGQRFLWRRAWACPCINPISGAANPKCTQCSGKGRIWDAAVPATAGVPSQKVQRLWAQLGRYEAGDLVLSIPSDSPLYGAGEFDRVTMLDGSDPFSISLTRGDGDRLIWPVATITRCFWLTAVFAIVEGDIPTADASGNLTWATGANAPPTGQVYSLSGTRLNEYYIYEQLVSDRPEHMGLALPKKVVCRKFDLLNR